jgi:regulator of RNase E activity RraA
MSVFDPQSVPGVPLPAQLMAELGRLDTCSVANAIEVTGVRLRNEGYVDSTVTCLVPTDAPLLGHAFTLTVRTSEPPIGGSRFVDRIDWWDRLLALPEPRVLVVQDVQGHPGSGSFLGEVHATLYQALGCAGIVTNGAVRDLPHLERLGFAAFAAHVSVSHAYAHVIDFGKPVTVGGLQIRTGELMHGDRHGVLSIPLEIAPDLPRIHARNRRRELAIIEYCRSPGRTVEGLRALLQEPSS